MGGEGRVEVCCDAFADLRSTYKIDHKIEQKLETFRCYRRLSLLCLALGRKYKILVLVVWYYFILVGDCRSTNLVRVAKPGWRISS